MDRNETIGVKTTLANGRVEQTIDGMTKRVVDIAAQHQDSAVRAALVQFGWTPPEESEELRRDAERYKWLRDSAGDVGWRILKFSNPADPAIDAAIDSARGVER